MTGKKEIVCLHCPKGCVINVSLPEGAGNIETIRLEISGQQCKHGKKYARQELVEPRRVLTTTVRVRSSRRMLSVRSSEPIPKDRIFAVMEMLNGIEVQSPVKIGQVIVRNILDIGVDIIATWSIDDQ